MIGTDVIRTDVLDPGANGSPASAAAAPGGWHTLPLQSGGRSLIEASAGTGKTWTIAVLYLRLVLEHALSPTQIVVTTFTDAAAEELRERIRGQLLRAERLGSALALAATSTAGMASADVPAADEQWLRARWAAPLDASGAPAPARIAADITRLRLALAELDIAPIGTLHGLCRKILADFPFESGSAFGLGEMVSSESLLQTLAEDVWRQLQQTPDPSRQPALDCRSVDDVRKILKAYLAPGVAMRLRPLGAAPEVALPPDMVPPIRGLLARKVFTSRRTFRTALKGLADCLDAGLADSTPLPNLAHLTPDPIADHIDADAIGDPDVRRVLDFAATAARALQPLADYRDDAAHWPAFEARIAAWRHWVDQARHWRRQRLAASGQLTFDELIERVHAALPPGDSALAERLFAAWPVALVDEFQDTDALQYGILDRIYRAADGAHRGRLVMIGDPKQAIYRFRGGDIHAYLKARDDADSRLSLDTNYRSSRAMVAACNAFYAAAGTTLSSAPDHAIRYQPVEASARCDDKPYVVDGDPCVRPLAFHYWHDCPDDADSRRRAALDGCANQIVALLASGRHRIGGTPLRPGDIAVLLPGNNDIVRLRALLNDRGVPCVSSARSSVFQSDWARELQIVLYAARHPRDEGAVRAALATRLGGTTYDELHTLRDQPERWQRHVAAYERLGMLWHTRGVLAPVQALIRQATGRLFAAGDSERSLTDLRHLGELLQTASEEFSGPEQLLAWLEAERGRDTADDGDAAREMQLRVESDAERVRLMTLHASKGLEFPVVLLPLMWANKQRGDVVIVHDAASGERVPGCGDADALRYQQEGQDERFRLLYVALTRARYACHVYVLPPTRPAQANAKTADGDPKRAPIDTMLARMLSSADGGQAPAFVHQHIAWCNDDWTWPLSRYQPDDASARPPRVALTEPPPAAFTFKWSFSSLTRPRRSGAMEDGAASDEHDGDNDDTAWSAARAGRDAAAATAAPDTDGAVAADEPPAPELLALTPIAGAEFGNALHAMFEHRRIGVPMHAQHALIRHWLLESGVRLGDLDPELLVKRLARRIQATLDTPLVLQGGQTVTLGALPARQLCAEMEFHYVLGDVAMQRLREVCAGAGEPELVPRTSVQHLRGLMHGKIDLVFQHDGRFHVLDYKGNRLGEDGKLSRYAPMQLPTAMDHSHYRFQALLYVIALDRYLRQRIGAGYDRSRHLGEAIYLFVRAVGLAPGAGVWTHRFSDALIDAVDGVLATPAQEAA